MLINNKVLLILNLKNERMYYRKVVDREFSFIMIQAVTVSSYEDTSMHQAQALVSLRLIIICYKMRVKVDDIQRRHLLPTTMFTPIFPPSSAHVNEKLKPLDRVHVHAPQ